MKKIKRKTISEPDYKKIGLEFDEWFEEYIKTHTLAVLGNIYPKWKKLKEKDSMLWK